MAQTKKKWELKLETMTLDEARLLVVVLEDAAVFDKVRLRQRILVPPETPHAATAYAYYCVGELNTAPNITRLWFFNSPKDTKNGVADARVTREYEDDAPF
jgi:hypothetical protein